MFKHFQRLLLEYIRENLGIYTLVACFFLAGIITGSILLRFMQASQMTELSTAVLHFMDGLKNETFFLKPLELLKVSYQKNILFLLVMWLLGLLWMGFPFILFILLLKGFSLGFTVGFLIRDYALKGMIFCLAAVLPHNIILVPAYIVAAVTATTFSLIKIKDRMKRKYIDRSQYFSQYCILMLIILFFILLGGLVEAYITPVFMRLTVNII
jgi:stage II sporulation protein M